MATVAPNLTPNTDNVFPQRGMIPTRMYYPFTWVADESVINDGWVNHHKWAFAIDPGANSCQLQISPNGTDWMKLYEWTAAAGAEVIYLEAGHRYMKLVRTGALTLAFCEVYDSRSREGTGEGG